MRRGKSFALIRPVVPGALSTRLMCFSPLVDARDGGLAAGAGESLANPALRGLILELNGSGERSGQSGAAVFSAISGAGFAPYRYEPFGRRLEPLEGPNRDGGNTLFLRNLPFVEGRVKGAAAVDVRGVAV